MDKLKWIESAGGPFILISKKVVGFWSGILNRNSYLANRDGEVEEAEDFLDPNEADYGKACLIEGWLGLTIVNDENVLVLGDEPINTTFFFSADKPILARWSYGENTEFVNNLLLSADIDFIDNWEFVLEFNITSDKQFLFDSACSQNMLNDEEYLEINLKSGVYKVSTTIYEPNDKTQLILHKFEKLK